jgi:hypothetical protein
VLHRELDLLPGLAGTRELDLRPLESGREGGVDLSRGGHLRPGALATEQLRQGDERVRLQGVRDLDAPTQGFPDPLEPLPEDAGVVGVKRRPESPGELLGGEAADVERPTGLVTELRQVGLANGRRRLNRHRGPPSPTGSRASAWSSTRAGIGGEPRPRRAPRLDREGRSPPPAAWMNPRSRSTPPHMRSSAVVSRGGGPEPRARAPGRLRSRRLDRSSPGCYGRVRSRPRFGPRRLRPENDAPCLTRLASHPPGGGQRTGESLRSQYSIS